LFPTEERRMLVWYQLGATDDVNAFFGMVGGNK